MKRLWLGSSLALLVAAAALSACSSSDDVVGETPDASTAAGSGGTGGTAGVDGSAGTGGVNAGGTGGVNAGGTGGVDAGPDSSTGGTAGTDAGPDSSTGGTAGTDASSDAPADRAAETGAGGDATAPIDTGTDGSTGACVFPALPACTGLTPITLGNACAAYADAFCSFYQRCNLVGADEMTDCRAKIVAGCKLPAADAGTGVTTYDGANAACCIKHLKDDVSCTSMGADINNDPACEAASAGTIATSGACYVDDECFGDAYCDTGSACPGTCKNYVAIGSACTSNDKCTGGGSCQGAKCVAQTFSCQDAPCTKNGNECFGGYYCKLPAADAGAGTCQALPASGSPCGAETSFQCGIGLACFLNLEAGFTGTCGALGTAGASCLGVFSCAPGFYCVKSDGGILGTCTANLAVGDTCDPTARDYACGRAIHTCQPITNKCGVGPALGEACSVATDNCQNSWCDGSAGDGGEGICSAKLAGGAACTSNGQCASDDCQTAVDGGQTCKVDCKRP